MAAGSLATLLVAVACGKGAAKKAQEPQGVPPGQLTEKNSLLRNADFAEGSLPWQSAITTPAKGSSQVSDGAYCVTMEDPGKNPWDVLIKHGKLVMEPGHQYTVHFRAWATDKTTIHPKIGTSGAPYKDYWGRWIPVGTEPTTEHHAFVMSSEKDMSAEFAFHIGGSMVKKTPMTVCIDDVYLVDPQFVAVEEEDQAPAPKVAVNQVGYLPGLSKVAVVESSAKEPLAWVVKNRYGETVLEGQTTVVGPDEYSGNSVHHIDFSALTKPGDGYVIAVGEDESYPFDVGPDVYSKLKYDALAYFYHNRSGIEIAMPYAGGEQWTRPAGHLPDKAPCAKDLGCDYTLDVTKGWYDAGDHGKYVVNGGISAWTVQNQYERLEHLGKSAGDFADGKMQIPENSNGAPDILDEARWEVEFLMAMQAPPGSQYEGMVHHKMHDEGWTAIGIRPDQDPLKRTLRPVSTAATLNMAAAAAQASRLWAKFDKAFSKKALAAAEKAYAAAKQHPEIYADPKDNNNGGGPYDDGYVVDEFYWAAAELFITTGDKKYRRDFERNPHHTRFKQSDNKASIMTWQTVDALGAISLATVPSKLGKKATAAVRRRLVETADLYLENVKGQGYRTPYAGNGGKYEWGSNSFVATNAMVLALAYDFTKKEEYRAAVAASMNYILGTNPLGQSYVSGYGDKPLKNPHHRFWAKQARSDFPEAPPGALSGGPNSELQDPYVQAAGLKDRGCAPQKCFLDNIEAWSVNEITINWNSPLAWVVAFLDEQGGS